MSTSAWLGVGFGLREPHLAPLLAQTEPAPAVLELTPSHYLGRPEPLDALVGRHHFVLHDVCASLATAEPLDRDYIDQVAALAARVGAREYSEHLAMTRSPGGIDLGHLVPVPRTRAQLEVLLDKLAALGEGLELPIAIELPTTTLALPPLATSMSEGAFVHALIERSGCGLHLDLDNLWVDACNAVDMGLALDLDPGLADGPTRAALERALPALGIGSAHSELLALRLASLPLDAVTRVHLAGGHVDREGWAIDSHSAPVSSASLALLEALRGQIQPRAIIIERDAALPSLAELLTEVGAIEQRWAGAHNPS